MNTLLFSTYRLSSKHLASMEHQIEYFGKEGNNYFFTTNKTTRLIDNFNVKHYTNYKQISLDKKFFDYRLWSDIENNIDFERVATKIKSPKYNSITTITFLNFAKNF